MIYLNEIRVESNIVNTSDLNKKVDHVIWILHPFFFLWMNSSLNLRREKLFVEMSSFDRRINKTKIKILFKRKLQHFYELTNHKFK